MLQSQLFGNTLKEVPEDVQAPSHQLLLRGGFIRQTAAGLYSYLPLGYLVLSKVKRIVEEELSKEGIQQLSMPVMHPAELWKESGRWDEVDEVMFKFKNHQDRELCLAVTNEEIISDLVRREVSSYRQLPVILGQIQLKFRDELRPRGGLLRLREFTMMDAYSFDRDEKDLHESYEKVTRAYHKILSRCGLDFLVVDADSGKMGGKFSHEYMVRAESGEDTVITCDQCNYQANQEKAIFVREHKNPNEAQKPMEEVTVPAERGLTVATQSAFHKAEPWRILKTIIYKGDEKEYVAAVIRGDLEINETKLANQLPFRALRLVSDEEIKELGTVKGFISTIKLSEKVTTVIVDESVSSVTNFITSPNEANKDLIHVNYERDFQGGKVADIASAQVGFVCGQCKTGKLQETRGVEVGHTFKLGTRYSAPMGLKYTDVQGKENLILMGCYGIGVDRIVAGAAEQHHDQFGIIWPDSIAPFHVHLIGLDLDDQAISSQAYELYEELKREHIEVLFDDRSEKAGFKFKDADLLGIPLRIVISKRSLDKGGVEVKKRGEKEAEIVAVG
ncbi:MAG: proline--tRNA ligase, partial [bacterium]